jgi:hypothetical protein
MDLGIVANKTTIRIIEKHTRTQFSAPWTSTIIKEVGDKFHHNFQVGLQTYLNRYMGANLGAQHGFNKRLDNEHRAKQ